MGSGEHLTRFWYENEKGLGRFLSFFYGALVRSSPPPRFTKSEKDFFSVQLLPRFANYIGRMNDTTKLQHIDICRIVPSRTPLRPVRRTDPEFTELMESIRTDGVLQPILVRPDPQGEGDYEVVEGNHRFIACKLVGPKTIPCMIKDLSDREVLIIQLKAQAVRPKETRLFEYARRLKKLMNDGLTIHDLCGMIDKGPSWVRQMLSLNKLIPAAQEKLMDGSIKATSAVDLATLPEHLQGHFLEDAIKMKVGPFRARVREAKRDYDAYLLDQRKGQHEDGYFPRIRSVKDIMDESSSFEAAGKVLTSCNANTPEMGWKACLAWLMRIDPVSVENRKAGIKEQKHEYLNAYKMRQKQRELIQNLTFDTINNDIGEDSP